MTAQSPVRDPATAEFSFSDLRPTDVLAASRRIAELVRRTPLVRSAPLSDLAGGDVYLKLENEQVTGSFKLRGAMNAIAGGQDPPDPHPVEILMAIRGNRLDVQELQTAAAV